MWRRRPRGTAPVPEPVLDVARVRLVAGTGLWAWIFPELRKADRLE